jgi:hypothetical protein
MMRCMRLILVCVVAALAVSAVMTGGASAAFTREPPEIGRCMKKKGGKWRNGTCKTPATPGYEKFEWYPAYGEAENGETKLAEKLNFTSVNKPETLIQLETIAGEGIGCKGQTAEGEVTGPKTIRTYNIAFTECAAAGFECTSTYPIAAHIGEVRVAELDGLIGVYKYGETHLRDKIANLFVPASGEVFTEFECGGIPVKVIGEVMNPLKANAQKLSVIVKFKAKHGKQKPTKFATDPNGLERYLEASKLVGGGMVQAGQSLTTIQTNEEKLEINTQV